MKEQVWRTNPGSTNKMAHDTISLSVLNLKRLENNDLDLPSIGSSGSAGIDFSACLKRPFKVVEQQSGTIRRTYIAVNSIDKNFRQAYSAYHKDNHQSGDPFTTWDNPSVIVRPGETILIPLGWSCSFSHYDGKTLVLKIYMRSSTGINGLSLANGTGIVDSDYRGELMAPLRNYSKHPIKISHGDRIVQGILEDYHKPRINEVKTLEATDRGSGGFGSTGKQ